MSRSTYLLASVISKVDSLSSEHVQVNDHDETNYGEESWKKSLTDANFDLSEVDRLDDHRNEYLAAVATDFGERSNLRFKEDENLQERRAKAHLGKYDQVNLLASRSYENSEGKVIKNHTLIEHNRSNNLLEGVQAWVSALADI